ncbi:MAG: heat-inducible transcription repressor HrcA [Nitrospiraceae bacterium]|nr:MAG: heat-inducible transcription repressor HrcA [Nitrospiraceae bacterium]
MEHLDERRKKILCSIIQSHIELNVPIGSFFITQNFSIGVSPATIRNTMANLEDLGYIMQPHTSAGRVPTEKGYRFYVDTLLEEQALSVNISLPLELSDKLQVPGKDNGKIVKAAAQTLSLYSHYLAIAIPPKTEDITLRRIKFVRYEGKKVLVVLISDEGTISNKIITLDKIYTQKQLDKAAVCLNSQFRGLTIKKVQEYITHQLRSDRIVCDQLIASLLAFCREMIAQEACNFAFDELSGASNLPDFATMKQIKEILRAIEDRQFMLKLLNQISGSNGIQVFVGMNNIVPALNELSMVISTYNDKKSANGAIGIIGPTRMNYKKLIPVVDYTAKTLTRILTEI